MPFCRKVWKNLNSAAVLILLSYCLLPSSSLRCTSKASCIPLNAPLRWNQNGSLCPTITAATPQRVPLQKDSTVNRQHHLQGIVVCQRVEKYNEACCLTTGHNQALCLAVLHNKSFAKGLFRSFKAQQCGCFAKAINLELGGMLTKGQVVLSAEQMPVVHGRFELVERE